MDKSTRLVDIKSKGPETDMQSTAKIIDLADYRQKRSQPAAAATRPMVMFVPMWVYVPVMMVPGYR